MSKKPPTAYQLYLQAWKTLPAAEKQKFERESAHRKELASIFLKRTYDRVSVRGLDNGFYRYECIGPAEAVKYYSDAYMGFETPFQSITIGGQTYTHNKKLKRKKNIDVYTIGTSVKASVRFCVSTGPAESYTQYENYLGETWRV
tara:strand:+ start:9119 stop:9553 length:435 start_codon:yes stop_codon:yes gene_type:complete